MNAPPNRLFHIAERARWESARLDPAGRYAPDEYEGEGFIHLSFEAQVTATAGRYYAGRTDVVVLRIDPARLDGQVVEENLLGGDERFPHLYATLPVAAVEAVGRLEWNGAGEATLSFENEPPDDGAAR